MTVRQERKSKKRMERGKKELGEVSAKEARHQRREEEEREGRVRGEKRMYMGKKGKTEEKEEVSNMRYCNRVYPYVKSLCWSFQSKKQAF